MNIYYITVAIIIIIILYIINIFEIFLNNNILVLIYI